MKNLITLFLIVLSVSSYAQTNSNWEYYRTNRWEAVKGKQQAFRDAAGKKTKMFNNSPETAMVTYQIMTGPDQGKFERVNVAKTLEQIYSENTAEQKYWSENVGKYVADMEGSKVWWILKDWSSNWVDGRKPFNYNEVNTMTIRGGETNFRRVMQRYFEVLNENNSTRVTAVFKISSGDQLATFRWCTFFDDPMKARGEWTNEEHTFEEVCNTKFGFNSYRTDMDILWGATQMYGDYVETMKLVPEMSFMGN